LRYRGVRVHDIGVAGIESTIRLAVALALGSAIGFERQWNQKMAGLRTNALVALGACGFVVFSAMVGEGDPTRVAAQVVTGIGFLGAGVILREGINVHGINTAATLWCSAMVGTFAGGGFWVPSINRRMIASGEAETTYTVSLTCRSVEEAHLRSLLLHALSQAIAAKRNDAALEQIVGRLSPEPHITAASWEVEQQIAEA
jgi:putative Mg2+ transporter-C (MgtC) family protein